MKTILVNASRLYPIHVGKNILSQCGYLIKKVKKAKKTAIITDDIVYSLYGQQTEEALKIEGFEVVTFIFPHGEASKSASTLLDIYNFLCENEITRTDLLIALGGGVVGDITGFAAATFLRGIDFVQIPTTLLAQVDSSVGGKTAIDLPSGKNLVGAFKQPICVICDMCTLKTLTPEIFSDGMGEVIKYGMISNFILFDTIATHNQDNIFPVLEDIICNCIKIKRDIVEADEFDTGLRMILNYGHTLAHAIESYYNYETYSHGSAVAVGMCLMAEKTLNPRQYDKLKECIKAYNLPTEVPASIKELIPLCGKDKKRMSDNMNFIICKTIGKAEIKTMPFSEFSKFMED